MPTVMPSIELALVMSKDKEEDADADSGRTDLSHDTEAMLMNSTPAPAHTRIVGVIPARGDWGTCVGVICAWQAHVQSEAGGCERADGC